jgi:adenylosuccinate synthase
VLFVEVSAETYNQGNNMLTCVTDLAFGDTGKGKIVDAIAGDYDIVVRYNGGPNAGHTIVVDNEKFSFHNLPSAMFAARPPQTLVLAGGMVANPISLSEEIKKYESKIRNLVISPRIHCIMPWHIQEDLATSQGKIGTTGKGVGPCYADKANRIRAVRMENLNAAIDDADMSQNEKNAYKEAATYLEKFICDERSYLRYKIAKNTNILFESANGIHLDIDHGSYPYVTSSGCGPAFIPQSCGLPNVHIDRIIGITKSYITRVGKGHLPTEITDDMAESIRKIGNEFGTTTGRPRRIGWLDLDILLEGVGNTGATEIAITHMDTLAKACKEQNINHFFVKVMGHHLEKPIWEPENISENGYALEFIEFVEDYLKLPVVFLGTGRDRRNLIERQTVLK